MRPRLVLLLSAVLSSARLASAQQTETVWHPAIGLTLGAPYGASAYVGLGRMSHLTTEWETFRGVAGIAEAGRGGGQLAIARAWEEEGLMTRLQGAVVRSWGNAFQVAPGQTFVSAQIQTSFVFGANIGLYRRVQGNAPGAAWFGAARLVIGF